MQFTTIIVTLAALASSVASLPVAEVSERAAGFYTPTFLAGTCATQASDYLTYSIQPTPLGCFQFCDSIANCKFVNYYQDLAANKQTNGIVYTCSAYSKVHTSADSTNCGQQNQVSGSPFKNTIINSNGFKKN